MSSSDWSSDYDLDTNDINEAAAVRVVKTSNQTKASNESSKIENPHTKEIKISQKICFEELGSASRLTSRSPKPCKSTEAKTPLNFKISRKILDIFEDIKSPPLKNTDITERCNKFKETVKAKIEKIAQDQLEIQRKTCTFKPKLINNKRSARNFEELLSEMKEYENSKVQKVACMKTMSRKDETMITHSPTISKNSVRIMKGKQEASHAVHDKLYKEKKLVRLKRDKNLESLLSFSPSVNKKSRIIKREADITQILFDDAIRRQSKKSESPNYKTTHKFTSQNSEKLLIERFKDEFSNQTTETLGDKSELVYTDLVHILEGLHFIKNDSSDQGHQHEHDCILQAWTKLLVPSTETIEKSSLLEFLLSVLNYNPTNKASQHIHSDFFIFYEHRHLSILSQKLQKHDPSRHMPSAALASVPVVTPCEIKRKLGKYLDPKKDSLQDKWNRLKKAQCKPEALLNLFVPKINRGPRPLLEKSFNDSDSLSSEYIKFSEEHSSKSVHRTEILYNFSKIAQEKFEQISKENYAEKNSEDYSFTPVAAKKSVRSNCEMSQVKGVSRLLTRLRTEKIKEKQGKKPRISGLVLNIDSTSNINSIGSQSPVDSEKNSVFSRNSSLCSDRSQ